MPATTHPTRLATLGKPISGEQMEAVLDRPGPIDVETVVGADWAVTRAGLIDLDNPKAKAAGLKDGDEPIQIFTHVVRHPTRGTFLIDTGVTRKLVDDPAGMGIGWVVRKYLHPEKMAVSTDTATLLRREPRLAGVLLTHLHLDHISGVPDLPRDVPLYSGPGDAAERGFLFMFSQGTIDRVLAGHDAIQELPFARRSVGAVCGGAGPLRRRQPLRHPGARAHGGKRRVCRPHARAARAVHRRHLAHALGLGARRPARQISRRIATATLPAWRPCVDWPRATQRSTSDWATSADDGSQPRVRRA